MGYLWSIVLAVGGVLLLVLAVLRLIGPVNRLRSGVESFRGHLTDEITALRPHAEVLAARRAARAA